MARWSFSEKGEADALRSLLPALVVVVEVVLPRSVNASALISIALPCASAGRPEIDAGAAAAAAGRSVVGAQVPGPRLSSSRTREAKRRSPRRGGDGLRRREVDRGARAVERPRRVSMSWLAMDSHEERASSRWCISFDDVARRAGRSRLGSVVRERPRVSSGSSGLGGLVCRKVQGWGGRPRVGGGGGGGSAGSVAASAAAGWGGARGRSIAAICKKLRRATIESLGSLR